MMYSEKLAVAIKSNGKILREFKDTVYVPFGSEYSLFIKNLNSVRAVVNISIDGQDVVPGGIVVYGNQSVDLERFIKNNNLSEGNRFKFIERTGAVEQHRGIGVEDGLIRIEYQFEKVATYTTSITDTCGIWSPPYQRDWTYPKYQYLNSSLVGQTLNSANIGGVMRGIDHSKGESTRLSAATATAQYCSDNNIAAASSTVHDGAATMDWNDSGITVAGSKSTQKFQTVSSFPTEAAKNVMVIKLLGETPDNKPVLQPVTVKHKPKCTSCGKQNKAHAKFCVECGTHLEIFA